MDYTKIFNEYTTTEGVPFYLLSKSITFPQDLTLDIYEKRYCGEDTAWTILSYKLYDTIDYWWVLSALNKEMPFYAERGSEILIIKPSQIKEVLRHV